MSANTQAMIANLDRIRELLQDPKNLDRHRHHTREYTDFNTGKLTTWEYTTINRENVELRERLKMLRRESVQFEKELMGP